MTNKDDLKHTNEFGEIEAHKHTKYWFKRDLGTIKSSLLFTIKCLPVVFMVSVLASWLLNVLIPTFTTFKDLLIYSFILFPVFSLGCFLFRIMLTKGYEIQHYIGTHVKNPQHRNRFSMNYIIGSDMTKSRKILFIIRLIFYWICAIGLFITGLEGLKKHL